MVFEVVLDFVLQVVLDFVFQRVNIYLVSEGIYRAVVADMDMNFLV